MAENVPAGKIWSYFRENSKDLEDKLHLVASDEEQGVEIYITNEKGFARFSVDVDGEEVYGADTVSSTDAENTYLELLYTYIHPNEDERIMEEENDARLCEITRAVEAMLEILIEDDPYFVGMAPQEVDELTSVIEEFLWDHCEISVRHPTYIDGDVVQYPFSDPDEDDADDLPDIKQ